MSLLWNLWKRNSRVKLAKIKLRLSAKGELCTTALWTNSITNNIHIFSMNINQSRNRNIALICLQVTHTGRAQQPALNIILDARTFFSLDQDTRPQVSWSLSWGRSLFGQWRYLSIENKCRNYLEELSTKDLTGLRLLLWTRDSCKTF